MILTPWPTEVLKPEFNKVTQAREGIRRPGACMKKIILAARILAASAEKEDRKLLWESAAYNEDIREYLRALWASAEALAIERACGLRHIRIPLDQELIPTRQPMELKRLNQICKRLNRLLQKRGIKVVYSRRLPLELRQTLLETCLNRLGNRRLPQGLLLKVILCHNQCAACFQLPYCDLGLAIQYRENSPSLC